MPVPAIAARRDAEIIAIGRTPEMTPFSIGGDYDRPICRRILEEAGVSRALFGQKKQAVALIFSWGPIFLSPEARTAFMNFLRKERYLTRVYASHIAFHLAHVSFRVLRKQSKWLPMLNRPLGRLRGRFEQAFRAYENSIYANALFVWALRQAVAREIPANAECTPPSTSASRAAPRDGV
jgi:hypothetical protein